jgi:uncharacterized phiE125 gp8 family phage protein
MALIMTSAPAIEPVTLADAKAHLRVDGTAEDAFISSLIITARLQVEAALGLALIQQGWSWRLDRWPASGAVELPLRPVAAVQSVRVQNSDLSYTVVAAANYLADGLALPPRLVPTGAGLPPPGVAALGCEIQFTAGFGPLAADVPAPLRAAILLLIAHGHENREPAADGALPSPSPEGVNALLNPYRIRRL